MKEFTTSSGMEPITFKIDDVEYSTRSSIPTGTLFNLVGKSKSGNDPMLVIDMMKTILSPESWMEMRKRLYEDHDEEVNFIDMKTIVEVVQWLAEELGNRPTQ